MNNAALVCRLNSRVPRLEVYRVLLAVSGRYYNGSVVMVPALMGKKWPFPAVSAPRSPS